MDSLAPLLLVVAVATFCAALYLFAVSLAEVRPLLPPGFQEREGRYAIDVFMWQANVPTHTRRKYVLALICASAAVGSIALLMTWHGVMLSAVLFSCVFVFMAVVTWTRLSKYRASL